MLHHRLGCDQTVAGGIDIVIFRMGSRHDEGGGESDLDSSRRVPEGGTPNHDVIVKLWFVVLIRISVSSEWCALFYSPTTPQKYEKTRKEVMIAYYAFHENPRACVSGPRSIQLHEESPGFWERLKTGS